MVVGERAFGQFVYALLKLVISSAEVGTLSPKRSDQISPLCQSAIFDSPIVLNSCVQQIPTSVVLHSDRQDGSGSLVSRSSLCVIKKHTNIVDQQSPFCCHA